MELLVLGILILAMAGHSSKPEFSAFASSSTPNCGAYCICKQGVSDQVLQKAMDYACGAGADCNPIRPNGQCYNPNTVLNHCSFAVNSYYQRKASSGATCAFGGAAMLTNSNPSGGGCSFSATSGSTGTGSTGTGSTTGTIPTTTPVSGTGTGVGVNPTTTSPYTTTPGSTPTGILGGVGAGLGPSGSSMDDNSVIKLETTSLGSILVALVISAIICLWN